MTATYRVLVTNRFEKDFRKLPKTIQRRLSEMLALLSRNPFAFEVLGGEFKGLRNVCVGDYRLIYRIDSEIRDTSSQCELKPKLVALRV